MCEREEVSSWEEDSQQLEGLGTSWCFLSPVGFFPKEQGLRRL